MRADKQAVADITRPLSRHERGEKPRKKKKDKGNTERNSRSFPRNNTPLNQECSFFFFFC